MAIKGRKVSVDMFYTPVSSRNLEDLIEGQSIIRIKAKDISEIFDRANKMNFELAKGNSEQVEYYSRKYSYPIINSGIMIIDTDDIDIYFKFKTDVVGDIICDIFYKSEKGLLIDPTYKMGYNDLINFGCFELSKDYEKNIEQYIICTSLGEVSKASQKGRKRFLRMEDLRIEVLGEIYKKQQEVMDSIHGKITAMSISFGLVNNIIHLSDINNVKKSGPVKYVYSDSNKNGKTTNNEDKDTRMNNKPIELSIDIDDSNTEIIRKLNKSLGKCNYLVQEWTVRGHHKKNRNGELIYIEPQVRRRQINNGNTNNKTEEQKEYIVKL